MKNDGTYFLYLRTAMGEDIEHKPLLVYPFEWQGLEFFAHRPYTTGLPLFDVGFWEVSEKSTGYALGDKNIKTMSEAKRLAIAKLEKVGIEKVKELIAQNKKDLKP
jgi:hypothetical protein